MNRNPIENLLHSKCKLSSVTMAGVNIDASLPIDAVCGYLYDSFDKAIRIEGSIYGNGDRISFFEFQDEEHAYQVLNGGIYFLMIDDYVSYVGMSEKSAFDRIRGSHGQYGHDMKKIFTSVKYLSVEFEYLASYVDFAKDYTKRSLEIIELIYINMFNPYFNILGNDGKYVHLLPDYYRPIVDLGRDMLNEYMMRQAIALSDNKFFNPVS